jgi:hypothetical protein
MGRLPTATVSLKAKRSIIGTEKLGWVSRKKGKEEDES